PLSRRRGRDRGIHAGGGQRLGSVVVRSLRPAGGGERLAVGAGACRPPAGTGRREGGLRRALRGGAYAARARAAAVPAGADGARVRRTATSRRSSPRGARLSPSRLGDVRAAGSPALGRGGGRRASCDG